MPEVTRLLDAAAAGDRPAAPHLVPPPQARCLGSRKFVAEVEAKAEKPLAMEWPAGRVSEISIFRVFQPPPAVVTFS
jgi:hypothetical protein